MSGRSMGLVEKVAGILEKIGEPGLAEEIRRQRRKVKAKRARMVLRLLEEKPARDVARDLRESLFGGKADFFDDTLGMTWDEFFSVLDDPFDTDRMAALRARMEDLAGGPVEDG